MWAWASGTVAGLGRVLAPTVALALAVGLVPGEAEAHGRFPATGQIVFHPSDPDSIVVRGTFGVLVSRDGGESWRWICVQALGARMTEDPALVLMEDGSILAAMFDGLARGTGGGCEWGFPDEDLEDVVVIDQARHPTDGSTSLAVTSSGGVDNLVYRSVDDGASWEPTGEPIDPILFESIEIAPGNAEVVYLTGAYPPSMDGPRRPFVYRSGDGAATWESFAWDGLGEGDRNIFLMGVDPTDATHLFMRVQSESDDRLLRSTDGGESWSVALAAADLSGFAWAPDGDTLWVGGQQGTGLYRSDDGGESFEPVRDDVEIGCLAHRDGQLWACGNNFSDGFAVGVSTDGGESFEPVLVFDQIAGIIECPEGSLTRTTCEPLLEDLRSDLGIRTDGGIPGEDGGDGHHHDDHDHGGCSCATPGTVGPSSGRGMGWMALLLGMVGLRAFLRRRRGVG